MNILKKSSLSSLKKSKYCYSSNIIRVNFNNKSVRHKKYPHSMVYMMQLCKYTHLHPANDSPAKYDYF